MKIALVTCRELPDWECDDRPLEEALAGPSLFLRHAPEAADTLAHALIARVR